MNKINVTLPIFFILIIILIIFSQDETIQITLIGPIITSLVTIFGFYIVFNQNTDLEKYKIRKNQERDIFYEIIEFLQPLKIIELYQKTNTEIMDLKVKDKATIHYVSIVEIQNKISVTQLKIRAFLDDDKKYRYLHDLLGTYLKDILTYLAVYQKNHNKLFNVSNDDIKINNSNNSDLLDTEYLKLEKSFEKIILVISKIIKLK